MAKVNQALPFASFCYPHLRGGGAADRIFNVAIEICDTLASLHQDGYVVVDGNDANVLVVGDRITWIDTDSFQIPASGRTFTSAVGHPEFTPAESIGRRKDAILKPSHDLFALGVMMFKLLFEGRHPFSCRYAGGKHKPALPERIQQGLWPYAASASRQILPPNGGRSFGDLHPQLRDLFTGCFEVGHGSPDHRPTAINWRTTIDQVRGHAFPARKIMRVPVLGAITSSVAGLQQRPPAADSDEEWSWGELLNPRTWVLTAQLLIFCIAAISFGILTLETIQFASTLNDSIVDPAQAQEVVQRDMENRR